MDFSNVPNKYLMLLKRLDEDEGLIEPSIEEKLKLAEDYLRLSCAKFCEAAAELLESKSNDSDAEFDMIDAEAVQELFQAKCFKHSLRPPKSQLITSSTERGPMADFETDTHDAQKYRSKTQKLQQAFYLPPSSWFSSEKTADYLSVEEVELLSSCATKTFIKFLEEKKMEIPRIFLQALGKQP